MMMANPRRFSYSNNHQIPISNSEINSNGGNNPFQAKLSELKLFLKKPHAIPFLLSVFLFLTWVFLRIQHSPQLSTTSLSSSSDKHRKWSGTDTVAAGEEDRSANLVRFASSAIAKDKRGWLLDPIAVALQAGISGGALTCASLHVGEIRPGGLRGNHRHHTCNETFLIWGAKMVFRLENSAVDKGYVEVTVGADEVAVATSPSGTAHALINIDPARTTFFLGCQDSSINYNSSTSDFNVWKDL